MKLPITLPFGAKKEQLEYYLALLLRDEKITAVIFQENFGKIRVVGEHEERFSTNLEHASEEELLTIVDKAISKAESTVAGNSGNLKTVFGVKESWVAEAKIKKEYLAKLKKVSQALGLTPIGFLVVSEAIAHLLAKEEGAPVSGILIELGGMSVTVSLLRAGKVIDTRSAALGESAAQTTDKLLHHFDHEVLPSRLIIFNGSDEGALVQEFAKHSWGKGLPFLHVPHSTPLPKRFDARAVLHGAATQLGFDIVGEEEPLLPKQHILPVDDEQKEREQEEVSSADAAAFGFMKEQDIATALEEEKEEIPDETKKEAKYTNDNFEPVVEEPFSEEKQYAIADEDRQVSSSRKKQDSIPFPLGTVMGMFAPLGRFIPKGLPLPGFSPSALALGSRPKVLLTVPLLLLVIIAAFIGYISLVKATVTLRVAPKVIERTEEITFTSSGETDVERKMIQAETITQEEEGSTSTDATGKKEVGEKAKGSITIYSNLAKEQTFEKGAVITASNNIKFTLDDTVKVASKAGASDPTRTVKVNVTAAEIGKEYNVPSGSKFTIGSFSTTDAEAKNDSAFSGGSKKEVTVVAKNDITTLEEELPKLLEEKAKEMLKEKITDDKVLLGGFVDTSLEDATFDKKAGEEASSVTLTATVLYQGLAYSKKDAETLAAALLDIEENKMTFATNGLTFDVKDVKKNNNTYVASVAIRGEVIPKVDQEALKQELAGKPFDQAREIVSKVPQVDDVEISLSPPLPFPQLLPRLSKNITIVTKQ